jgi:hypothetical protein
MLGSSKIAGASRSCCASKEEGSQAAGTCDFAARAPIHRDGHMPPPGQNPLRPGGPQWSRKIFVIFQNPLGHAFGLVASTQRQGGACVGP